MISVFVYRNKSFFRKMEMAVTIAELAKGLLGRTTAGKGLFLKGAPAIHTFGMKFPIDVVYLDQEGWVVGLEERLPPNRQGAYFQTASHVVEMNPGTIRNFRVKVGEKWSWRTAAQ